VLQHKSSVDQLQLAYKAKSWLEVLQLGWELLGDEEMELRTERYGKTRAFSLCLSLEILKPLKLMSTSLHVLFCAKVSC